MNYNLPKKQSLNYVYSLHVDYLESITILEMRKLGLGWFPLLKVTLLLNASSENRVSSPTLPAASNTMSADTLK